jgi:hypothetical protein
MICSTTVASDVRRGVLRISGFTIPFSFRTLRNTTLVSLALLWMLTALPAGAQWKVQTPRDTVKIFANQPKEVLSKLQQPDGVTVSMTFSKTFGIGGQNGTGFDARYMYENIPGWSTPTPLLNPPTYGNKSYKVYVELSANTGIIWNPLQVNQTSYQPNHIYSTQVTSRGVPFSFVIRNRIDERPDNFYYGQASGYIEVALARFTAGIRVQSSTLEFGNVAIGNSKTILDSIQSYGVDPLSIDSAHIEAAAGSPGATDFRFISDAGIKYTLPSEQTNTYRVTYTPSSRNDAYAKLVIFCRNTDNPSRIVTIPLHGVGTAPISVIGPKSLDFGKVRVSNSSVPLAVNISNVGNGDLAVQSIDVVPTGVFTASPYNTTVSAAGTKRVTVFFKPTAVQSYNAKLVIKMGQTTEEVTLTGEGAMPSLRLTESVLNFGTVRRSDQKTLKVTLSNVGNWTANLRFFLTGSGRSNFTVVPNNPTFLLNPGASQEFVVTFSPATGPEGTRTAEMSFYDDDGSAPQRVQLVGAESEPKLSIGRQFIDFGKMFVGYAKSDTVSLINTSNARIAFATPQVLPAGSPFSVRSHGPHVDPQVRDSLVIDFRPMARGQFSAKVYTDAEGQKDSIYVIGTGAQPKAVFKPSMIDFGTVPVGYRHSARTQLTDTGDFPLHVKSFSISDSIQGFSVGLGNSSKPPFTVYENTIGKEIWMDFQTTQRSGKIHYAYLVLHYEEGGSDSVLMVAKEQAEFVRFNESSIDFGKIPVGTESEKLATFSHGSLANLWVGRAWVEQPSPFHSDSSDILVPTGKTAQTRVTFKPTVKGTFTGFLLDTGGDVKGQDTLRLYGVGAQSIAALSDDTLDFGLVYHHLTQSRLLSLKNEGDWDLKWTYRVEGDPVGEFVVTADTNTFLAEGKSTDFNVVFTPKQPEYATHEADLIFTFDNGTEQTVHLIAYDSIPFLILDSTAIDFGKIRVPNFKKVKVHLVNTTPVSLQTTGLAILPSGSPYFADNSGVVKVAGPSAKEIEVTFAPTAMGTFDARLEASGNDMLDSATDIVMLHGIGAMPAPKFDKPIVDFGRLTVGVVDVNNVTLTNEGNWELHITKVEITGLNAPDYKILSNFPQDTIIAEGESTKLLLRFEAMTALQATPRDAKLVFTIDDGSTFSIDLTELDKAPLGTEIGFETRLARPGDAILMPMSLNTAIPPEFLVRSLSGEVTFDPSVVKLTWHGKGPLIGNDRWNLSTQESAGKLTFQISSETDEEILSDPGVLIRFNFLALTDVAPGAKSDLHVSLLNYPDTKEVKGVERMGVIIIDSTCGSTHIMEGGATANMVDQNTPNPFGKMVGADYSYIPFDVGADGTLVTIRILDETGKEVLRPVDNLSYVQGRYRVRIHARSLTSGLYFYEFRAGTAPPVMKKMVVSD